MTEEGGAGRTVRRWLPTVVTILGFVVYGARADASLQTANSTISELKERVAKIEATPPIIPPAVLERLAKQEQALVDIQQTVHQIQDYESERNAL